MVSFSFPTRLVSSLYFQRNCDFYASPAAVVMTVSRDVRAEYRSLQARASSRLSEAVSESTKLFTALTQTPKGVAKRRTVRDSFDPKAILSKTTDISQISVVSESSTSAPVKPVGKPSEPISTTPAIRLLEESEDRDEQFVALISQLMQPSITQPVPSRPVSPVPSVMDLSGLSTRRPKTPSTGPRGFGSSQPRFSYSTPRPLSTSSVNLSFRSVSSVKHLPMAAPQTKTTRPSQFN